MKKPSEPEPLGTRIERLRERRGMTRGALARAIAADSGPQLVRNWEQGDSAPTARWLPALADALGVTCDELLRGVP